MPLASPAASPSLTNTPEWQALQRSAAALAGTPLQLKELFSSDAQRLQRFSCEAAGLLLDYSKNLLTDAIHSQLLALARRAGMQDAIGENPFRCVIIAEAHSQQVLIRVA